MSQKWSPDSWRSKPYVQIPDFPDKEALKVVEERLSSYPPLVFAGEARALKRSLGKVAEGEAFLLAGRRLRGKLCRAWRRQYSRFFPRVPADVGGADLCGGQAGRQGRPHCRPVCQAALVRFREKGRCFAAKLSRRHHQRHRI